MAQSGSFKTKIGDARDPIGNEMKAITIDDAEATNLEEEEEEGVVEDAENSLFDLFIERKRSVIMKRLENISDDDLAALNSDEGEDCSILDFAVIYRDIDLTMMLLEETNYTVIPNYGLTVLHVAARYQMNDILDILAPIAGQVDILNQDGETPLMYAVKGNNEQGVEIFIRAGADIHRKSQDGKTALYYASAEGRKICIQAAASNDIKEMIHLERLTRPLYPVHIVARNGDLKALQKWLSATTVKGPGRKQVWHGKHLQNGDSTDIELQLKLVRDTEINKCVGTFADDCGVYHLSGEWNASQLQIKKSYVDIKRIVEYDGEVDDETGEWTGEYYFSIPFFQCSKCSSKVPEENVLCFKCESVEPTSSLRVLFFRDFTLTGSAH
ncbi:hypothetical protein LEN26_013584 [Aphanomyces euteiches]|nr:hypothetical protein LEN26_013584 [Aphanomyces euteiches]